LGGGGEFRQKRKNSFFKKKKDAKLVYKVDRKGIVKKRQLG